MAIAAKRSVPAKRSLKTQALTESESKVQFGVVIEISGHTIALSGPKIEDAKKKGLEFNIPAPVTLGALADVEVQGFKLSSITNDLPDFFKPVTDTILNMVWTVERAHVQVPGSESPDKDKGVQYTLQMNGKFNPAIPLGGVLNVVGIVFGASNEPAKEAAKEPTKT